MKNSQSIDSLFEEKLGEFYLGSTVLPEKNAKKATLYDASDLTTHAVIIGMTGSGKTGLGISLLEEASLDNIPVIAIDPKGDLGNLAFNFPERQPEQFEPWLDAGVASSQGLTTDELAKQTAKLWDDGLKASGQSQSRQQMLADANEINIYTPGSKAGIPIALLSEFVPPPLEIREDGEVYAESLDATVSGLLGLIGVEADSLSSEHIFLAQILKNAWDSSGENGEQGQTLSLADLIGQMMSPPFEKIGVLPIDAVISAKKRQVLAMKLNSLLASPSFANWLFGVPLDTARLFYGNNSKAQTSVLNIAHLSDDERMFFVTLLLNNLINWMRRQQGTSTLRAILYMDEVVGYLPPTANPPSKRLLMLLLKQARAFGVGVVLSTQNPSDLDYKALSNTGTWLIGRLQTAQDRDRVTQGLLSSGSDNDGGLDKAKLNLWFDQLGKRQFLLHNVHASAPQIFKTRWAMSYLSGPLGKSAIERLNQDKKVGIDRQNVKIAHTNDSVETKKELLDEKVANNKAWTTNKSLPDRFTQAIDTWYFPTSPKATGKFTVYEAMLLAHVSVRYEDDKSGTNQQVTYALQYALNDDNLPVDWQKSQALSIAWDQLQQLGHQPAEYNELASQLMAEFEDDKAWQKTSRSWKKSLRTHVRQNEKLDIWFEPSLKIYGGFNESESSFRQRLELPLREQRDMAVKAVKENTSVQQKKLEIKKDSLEHKLESVERKAKDSWMDAGLSIGNALIGMFSSRRKVSVSNARRMKTAVNQAGRAKDHKDKINAIKQQIAELEYDFEALFNSEREQLHELAGKFDNMTIAIEKKSILAKARDIEVVSMGVGFIDVT